LRPLFTLSAPSSASAAKKNFCVNNLAGSTKSTRAKCRLSFRLEGHALSCPKNPSLTVDLCANFAARRSHALPLRLRENLPGRATLCGAAIKTTFINLHPPSPRQIFGPMELCPTRSGLGLSLVLERIPWDLGFGSWDFLSGQRVRCPERSPTCQPPDACAK